MTKILSYEDYEKFLESASEEYIEKLYLEVLEAKKTGSVIVSETSEIRDIIEKYYNGIFINCFGEFCLSLMSEIARRHYANNNSNKGIIKDNVVVCDVSKKSNVKR